MSAVLDLVPQVGQAGLGPFQLGQTRIVGQDSPVLEIDQLEAGRRLSAQAPQHQGVEAHLEQRLLHETRAGAAPGLVVDHSHGAVGCHVQTVHEASQEQAITSLGLDEELALGRFQALGVLQGEVGANESAGLLQPGLHLVGVLEQVHDLRVLLTVGCPLAGQELEGRLWEAFRGRKIVETLQHSVDHGALVRRQRTGLGKAVDRAQTEHERALHEVLGPRGGQGRAASAARARSRTATGTRTGGPDAGLRR